MKKLIISILTGVAIGATSMYVIFNQVDEISITSSLDEQSRTFRYVVAYEAYVNENEELERGSMVIAQKLKNAGDFYSIKTNDGEARVQFSHAHTNTHLGLEGKYNYYKGQFMTNDKVRAECFVAVNERKLDDILRDGVFEHVSEKNYIFISHNAYEKLYEALHYLSYDEKEFSR